MAASESGILCGGLPGCDRRRGRWRLGRDARAENQSDRAGDCSLAGTRGMFLFRPGSVAPSRPAFSREIYVAGGRNRGVFWQFVADMLLVFLRSEFRNPGVGRDPGGFEGRSRGLLRAVWLGGCWRNYIVTTKITI
jgi:hypothetical protein